MILVLIIIAVLTFYEISTSLDTKSNELLLFRKQQQHKEDWW